MGLEPVVVSAQRDQVAGAGAAAARVRYDVVAVARRGRAVAPGEQAVTVADAEMPAQPLRYGVAVRAAVGVRVEHGEDSQVGAVPPAPFRDPIGEDGALGGEVLTCGVEPEQGEVADP